MKKGLEDRSKSGMTLRFSGWGRIKMPFARIESKGNGLEGKVRNLRPNGDDQEIIRNTE